MDFVYRFVIAACVIFIGEKLLGVLNLNPDASKILTIILIICAVLFVLFGSFLPFK